MQVGKPSALMFFVSLILALIALISFATPIPMVTGTNRFYLMTAAWGVLTLSTLVRGI